MFRVNWGSGSVKMLYLKTSGHTDTFAAGLMEELCVLKIFFVVFRSFVFDVFCVWEYILSPLWKRIRARNGEKGQRMPRYLSPQLLRLVFITGFLHSNCSSVISLCCGESLLIIIIWIHFTLPAYPSACQAPAAQMALPSGRCLNGWSPSRWASTARTSPALGLSPWNKSCRWKLSKCDMILK